MRKHNDFDIEMEGQLSLEDLFSPPERMIAVSNIFARARKQMSLAEQKTFVLALSQLEWTKSSDKQSNIVHLDNKILQNVLGYKSDSTDISQHIWDAIKLLAPNSYIEIAEKDTGFFTSGSVVATITKRKGTDYVRVKFEEDYFPLFTGLGSKYITMWSTDIFQMTSKRSVQFYELLRQLSFDKHQVGENMYSYGWGIKAFKEMFDIPKEGKGSYVRDKGGFDRTNFEKKVIEHWEDYYYQSEGEPVPQPNPECPDSCFDSGKINDLKLKLGEEDYLKLLSMLKDALAEELLAWYHYTITAPFLHGKRRPEHVKFFKETAKDEFEDHACWLMERLQQLGSDPNDIADPAALNVIATHKYIIPSYETSQAVMNNITAEKGAIETYTKLEEFTKDRDIVTHSKIEEILKDEQEHLQELEKVYRDIADIVDVCADYAKVEKY